MRKRVLVAESSDTILDVCRSLLTERGYEPRLFRSGEVALSELGERDYDLVVVATELDQLNGYELVAKLRQQDTTKGLPVLMLVGSSELMDPNELANVHPDATVTKPFSPQEFLHKIDLLISRPVPDKDSARKDDFDVEGLRDDPGIEQQADGEDDENAYLHLLAGGDAEPAHEAAPRINEVELIEDSPRNLTEREHDTAEAAEKPSLSELDELRERRLDDEGDLAQAGKDSDEGVYLEESETGFASIHREKRTTGSQVTSDLKSEFVRQLADSLAREIAAKLDVSSILERLDSLLEKEKSRQ
jgi:CheY-like chemotaxis protein